MGGSPSALSNIARVVGKEEISAPPSPWGCQPLRFVLVGPKTRNQASDDSGGPSGSSAPAMPQGSDDYRCEYPGCNRVFTTNRGRGVHHQRAHKNWYDAQLRVPGDKARWTPEEVALIARKEAELTTGPAPPRFMNQELLRWFPQRTLEAIKGRRKRQDYKDLVVSMCEDADIQEEIPLPVQDDDILRNQFLEYVESLEVLNHEGFQAGHLQEITKEAREMGREATSQRLALYLREIFPPPKQRKSKHHGKQEPAEENRRSKRRREYAMTQQLWRKNRGRCVTNILDGLTKTSQPPRGVMEPYWSAILNAESANAPTVHHREIMRGIWEPITGADLRWGRVPKNSAAGPDGVSARLLGAMPAGVLVRIYNLLMWCEKLPEDLLRSRTIFLPKKNDATEPGDFRPITIPSVLVRGLHKILAKRMECMLEIDPRQRAFRSTDGCSDNIFLLDTILRFHRRRFRSMYMAALDVSKAFDSISHEAIKAVLMNVGIPEPMIRYLNNVYQGSTTRLEGENWRSALLHPRRGVRQGDPLSPIIFNAMTHLMLRTLSDDIGVRMGDLTINAAAFADDLLLFATTPNGLQNLIDRVDEFLVSCGMTVNPRKSLTLCIRASAHEKKTAVDATAMFKCCGQRLPSLNRTNEWHYLGVKFTPEGRTLCRPAAVLGPLLEKLTRAPLKPQQRMFALRTMVIPKLYHQLALGAVTINTLNKTDKLLRAAVRKWLALPHDVPTAYFHAAIRDGGLGIPSLRWTAPLQRRGRLLAAKQTHPGLSEFAEEEVAKCSKRLTDHGTLFNTQDLVNKRWRDKLYIAVDGGGLKPSRNTPHQHQWVADGTRFLTGRDYVNCNRLRISALPTKARTTRGRTQDRRCRAGCLAQETLNHVLQQCHRTHAMRIKRHNAVLGYMERRIHRMGFELHKEPHYRTEAGLRKPDLVAVLGQTAVVVDAQVVGEQADLAAAHKRKKDYYGQPGVVDVIKASHNVRTVHTTSATLSWKGVWSPDSAQDLRNLGFINTGDLKVISTRVLIGGLAEFRIFNSTTSSARWRTGVG